MSTVDLILLGLVYDQPQSAYDIQKDIGYRNLSKWVKISSPSAPNCIISAASAGVATPGGRPSSKIQDR